MATSDEWQKIPVTIWATNYVRDTEKAKFYKLWGKKPQWIPKQFIGDFQSTETEHCFTLPKWFIEKNNLKSLVDEEFKDLFPKKVKQPKEMPLLDGVEPLQQETKTVAHSAEPIEEAENWF